MSDVRLTIQIATTGRPTLPRMLTSIVRQVDPRLDEVLIVGDLGAVFAAIGDLWREWPVGLVRLIPCAPGHDWGHTERNRTMGLARGTHLVFGDDDDAFRPGAIAAIRASVAGWSGPVMFRMQDHDGAIRWDTPQIACGNHGTPQFVIPNRPETFGTWTPRHGGDFDFVVSTLAHYPAGTDAVKWDPTVIYGCRQYADQAAA